MMSLRAPTSSFAPGDQPCRVPSLRRSNWHPSSAANSKPWPAPAPPPTPSLSAVASSCGPPNPMILPTKTLRWNSAATATPSASGGSASWPTAWPACKTPRAPGDPGAFPPDERLLVLTLASSKTEDHQTPDSSWSLQELAFTIVQEAHHRALSLSTIQRILAAADLKPHRSVYWL